MRLFHLRIGLLQYKTCDTRGDAHVENIAHADLLPFLQGFGAVYFSTLVMIPTRVPEAVACASNSACKDCLAMQVSSVLAVSLLCLAVASAERSLLQGEVKSCCSTICCLCCHQRPIMYLTLHKGA